MKKLSCFGDMCPLPLLKAIESLKKLPYDEPVMVITDHSCVVESIEEYFSTTKYTLSTEEPLNGVWEITIQLKI